MTTDNKNKDDYKVVFGGTTISKRESNKAGLALIFGMIGAILVFFVFRIENKIAVFFICLVLSCIGYFVIAPKIFKK